MNPDQGQNPAPDPCDAWASDASADSPDSRDSAPGSDAARPSELAAPGPAPIALSGVVPPPIPQLPPPIPGSHPEIPPIPGTPGRRRGAGSPWLLDHDPSSRELLVFWCLWLLGSWGVVLLLDSPVPAARWMVFAAMCGMMLLWPLLRLSQAPEPAEEGRAAAVAARQALKDWLSLNLVFQAVAWPLQLTAEWRLSQTAWLSGAMAAWSLLSAALVAWGCRRPGAGARTVAMVLCVLLILGEPLALAGINVLAGHQEPGLTGTGRAGGLSWLMYVSPIDALWAVTDTHFNWDANVWGPRVVGVGGAGLLAWWGLARSAKSKAGRG